MGEDQSGVQEPDKNLPKLQTTFTLRRVKREDTHTAGRLYWREHFLMWILEDTDRSLDSSMSLDEIDRIKIYGKTAIPYGKYEIRRTMSSRFKKVLPILIDVPGFSGIRIHPGNTHENTEGCLLPGLHYVKSQVIESRKAFGNIDDMITHALSQGQCYIDIIRG